MGVSGRSDRTPARRRVRTRAGAVVVLVLALAAWLGPDVSRGASTPVVVKADVQFATWIDAAGCASFTADVTDFGAVPPGSNVVTSLDCAVKFGATNDTAMLRTYQQDGTGGAMWRPADGVLDTTFSGDGIQTTLVGGSMSSGYSMVAQPDGKVVLAGYAWGTNSDFGVLRYNTDGSLDTTFSGDGMQTTTVNAAGDQAYGVALQADGKIVAVGYSAVGAQDIAVVRYNADGTLDTTFSGDGIQTTAVGAGADLGWAVTVQPDGKILVGGGAVMANENFVVVRYNADGTLDATFSGDGIQTTDMSPGNYSRIRGIALQGDGKIVVGGYAYNGSSLDFAVARYNADGSLDTTFSGDGKLTRDNSINGDAVYEVAIQPDGKIVLGGYSYIGGTANDFAVLRYAADGTADATFSGDGLQTTSIGAGSVADVASSMVLQPDGRIVLAGSSSNGANLDFALARYTTSGSLDTGFSGDGKVTTAIGAANDSIEGVAFMPDGKITAGGYRTGGSDMFAAARYTSEGVPDYAGGTSDWTNGNNMFGACLRAVSGGATSGGSAWTEGPGNACPATNGAYWNPIAAASPGSKIAYTAAPDAQGGSDPTANLRFGLRAKADQAPGLYSAPIVLEVIAPNA